MLYVAIITAIITFILMLEGIHTIEVGSYKPKKVDLYLKRVWDKLEYNEFGHTQFYVPEESFVSKGVSSLTSKWYIRDIGKIPRWSPWSKKLDQKFEELQKEYFTK